MRNRTGPLSESRNDQLDLELLLRVAQADRAAFERLYLRHHKRLAGFIARFLGRGGNVEDAVNDTMMIVWQRAGEYRGASLVSTWIFGIAYRCALKTVRRRVAWAKADALAVEGEAMMTSDTAQTVEDRQLLELGLASLPHDQRIVLVLAYYLDHSCEEIAEIVGCPLNTVKSRMFHARRKLGQFITNACAPSARRPSCLAREEAMAQLVSEHQH